MATLRRHGSLRGMTLIELMVVVVVIGILAAIAYPSYQEQVRKARRADGQATLMEVAQQLERCYTRFASYVGNDVECGIVLPRNSPEEYYAISEVPARTASSFSLRATPQGDQTNDAKCGNLTLTHDGTQGSGGTADATECW
jgi:type IV pilus assembly protein PilE